MHETRKVINVTVTTTPQVIQLPRHRNLIITTYDDDLLYCENATLTNAQEFLWAGESITLLGDENSTIILASKNFSTRVRIILW